MTTFTSRSNGPGLARRLARWARLLVAFVVLVGFAIPVSASTFVVHAETKIECCCPHPDDAASRAACPCCHRSDDGTDHCLPLGEASCSQAPFVAPALQSALVPTPVVSDRLAIADVPILHDRLAIHRLERPPRVG